MDFSIGLRPGRLGVATEWQEKGLLGQHQPDKQGFNLQ